MTTTRTFRFLKKRGLLSNEKTHGKITFWGFIVYSLKTIRNLLLYSTEQ